MAEEQHALALDGLFSGFSPSNMYSYTSSQSRDRQGSSEEERLCRIMGYSYLHHREARTCVCNSNEDFFLTVCAPTKQGDRSNPRKVSVSPFHP